ncbi:MAG: Spy/CpxP family protein refolding chaperone [Ignavibacteriales bacterium]|nr:Spy/CpxP family protein refolding chaperone [Ignavibacteriales bacterium]
MKKLLFFIFALSCFTVFAQPRFENRKDIMRKLDLTKEQAANIEALRLKHQKGMIDMHADLRKLQIDKKELFKASEFNRKAALDLEEKIVSLRNKIHLANFNHRMDVYASLTPEQRDKVPALLNERINKRGNGCGFRQGRGMGYGGGQGNMGCINPDNCPRF